MFGDRFLVAPKAETPTENVRKFHAPVNVEVYLPVDVNWYFYWSGQPVAGQSTIQTVPIAQNEQGVWIREGSIIPLLNFEQGRMSLLEAINDPVNLLVYPTVESQFNLGTASGDLYLDDGENNNYL